MKGKVFSPYIAGVIIGLLQIPTILLANMTLGTSGSFITMAKESLVLFVPFADPASLGHTNLWQVGISIGIVLGAWLYTYKVASERPVLGKRFGQTALYIRNFFGGFLLLVGARLANGCTTGNGISGTAQLDLSSWLVLIIMFSMAIGVAQLVCAFSTANTQCKGSVV
ncbi:MAG: hypothetical protein RLZ12_41 [Bacillota bacterium]|jgi:uncharacterized membrane protein YedE/YeeE